MQIKANSIVMVPIDQVKPNSEDLIKILEKSKNLLRFRSHYFEMQVFDQLGGEHFVKMDYQDIARITSIRWRGQIGKGGYVAIVATHNESTILQSRTILNLPESIFCDHKNGDPTDNRLENLRPCSHSENMRNRKSLVSGRKYKGIYFCKTRNKWVAQISENGKIKNIGRFYTDKQAAIAYNEEAKRLYGEFAKLNEIE